MKNQFIE